MAVSVTQDRMYCVLVTANDYQFAIDFLKALIDRHEGFSQWVYLLPGFEAGHTDTLVTVLQKQDPKCVVVAHEAHTLVTHAFRVCADRVPPARVKFDVTRTDSDDPVVFADRFSEIWHEVAAR